MIPLSEKAHITRKATEKRAADVVAGSEAWVPAVAGIVGGWLVLVGSVANAIKLREQHDWPWKNLTKSPREWLFYGGIIGLLLGYPLMRFSSLDAQAVADKMEEKP